MLDDLVIVHYRNLVVEYSEINSNHPDPEYFKNFPHKVTYKFNSRGFRDREWPSDLINPIWCIGDSFTVGAGSPDEHTWCYLLEQATNRRCINVSLNDASNAWIARRANQILTEVAPKDMIIQWSFTHRRELPLQIAKDRIWQNYYADVSDPRWPKCASFDDVGSLPDFIQQELIERNAKTYLEGHDLDRARAVKAQNTTVQEDAEYTQQLIQEIELAKGRTRILHSHVPFWHPEPLTAAGQWIREYQRIDYGKDKQHYGVKTAEQVVDRILEINDYAV